MRERKMAYTDKIDGGANVWGMDSKSIYIALHILHKYNKEQQL